MEKLGLTIKVAAPICMTIHHLALAATLLFWYTCVVVLVCKELYQELYQAQHKVLLIVASVYR